MASIGAGASICNACGSSIYRSCQLVKDCCADESNLSAMNSPNPHVKFVIFIDEPVKRISQDTFTSMGGLLNNMPSFADAGISILCGSGELEIRIDAYSLCDVVVSLASNIRLDLFVMEAMATGTKVIASAGRRAPRRERHL